MLAQGNRVECNGTIWIFRSLVYSRVLINCTSLRLRRALVWISDGANVPPTADWLWGVGCGDEVGSLKACPDSGSLVLFAGPFDSGYTHGTQCASNIAGQGVVNDGLTPTADGGASYVRRGAVDWTDPATLQAVQATTGSGGRAQTRGRGRKSDLDRGT